MKCFVVFATVLACVAANPQIITSAAFPYTAAYPGAPALTYTAAAPAVTYAAAPAITYAAAPAVIAPAFTKTQYHAQDELGQASHGYAYPGQAAAAVRDAAGNERGSYAYVNPEGQEIRVDYTAGHGGFQVASNALPVAPAHIANLPAPVADTPEVAAAKAEHFQAVQDAKARNAAADLADGVVVSRKKRGVLSTYAAPITPYAYATAPLAYATSYSYRYDAPRPILKTYAVAPAPIVKTIAPAPIIKTYAVAPAPVVKTIAPAPIVKTIAPAPIVKTYAVAPAPIVKTYAAPIVKTYAPAIAYAPAPIKTYSYVSAPLRTYSYAPSFYSYSPYYGYGSAYGYGYSKFLG